MINSSGNLPCAVIISELDDLSFSFCRQLLDENCLLKIICRNKKQWTSVIQKEGLQKVVIVPGKKLKDDPSIRYIIYHLNFYKLDSKKIRSLEKEEFGKISLAMDLAKAKKTKTLLLLPAHKLSKSLLGSYSKKYPNDNLTLSTMVYFTETLGPYYKPSLGIFGNMVLAAAKGKPVGVPRASFPLSSSYSCAREIVKILFSFGSGQEIVLVGKAVPAEDFFQTLLENKPSLSPTSGTITTPTDFPAERKITVEGPSHEEEQKALFSLRKEEKTEEKRGLMHDSKKGIFYFVFSLCLFLVLPYLVLFVSAGFLIGAGALVVRQKNSGATQMLQAANSASATANRGFSILVKLPLGKQLFGPGIFVSSLIQKSTIAGSHAISAISLLKDISQKFFAEEPYEVSSFSEQLALELDLIYRELGFLQGELSALGNKLPLGVNENNIYETISQARQKTLYAKSIAQGLPWILGQDQKRTYLLLFQNNMELRPTGGYIGSFAVVGVEKGRLVDMEIQDVFSADGQLKGHVEPPEPIKKYLGEAGWYLRDSNWDPEFSVSAQRAEWFLDKELGLSFDGVIALDLEAVRKFLDVSGEINVPDYSKKISSKNIYEETRAEIEENFFPGSRVKASFLTAVASSLLTKISERGEIDRLKLGKAAWEALEERNIQVFLHNGPVLKALDFLGWTGSLPDEICPNPCFGDWLGLAEANLGVNKANYYIERKAELLVELKEGQVKRTLTIAWSNKAPKELGEKGRYETYLRVLVPRGSFSEGQKKIGQSVIGFSPDVKVVRSHIEAGGVVEVFPQETSTVTFSWVSPAEIPGEKGEYVLKIRKQAGTVEDAWTVKITNRLGKVIIVVPEASLTGGNTFGYNTILARDFVSRISW
jgi:hypothetical protein